MATEVECIRMAKFDLTSRMGQYLDRHLVFPLLEFLSVKEIYDEHDMAKGKLDLVKDTKMVDFAMDLYTKLYPDQVVPTSLSKRREDIVSELKRLQSDVDNITSIFQDEKVAELIGKTRDGRELFNKLHADFNFQPEMIETLFKYAKYQYECGNYSGAAQYLYFCITLLPHTDKKYTSALWGKLASEILMQNWDHAMEDLEKLRELIDSNTSISALQALQQRTWLIHWSLFVFFNHPKGRDNIIDLFLYQPQAPDKNRFWINRAPGKLFGELSFKQWFYKYLNAIQTMCPHILRYLTTAVITNKRRKAVLKDLVKVIQQEAYTYRDPITEFLECLYVNFDFDGAQQKLIECETVLTNDFFLVACLDDFIENARLFIFETFCRIHLCISISMLAEKLNMTPDEAEKWIVNLIRNARIDAKIDSIQGHVVMGTQAVSTYQQVIEKTKGLAFRSQMLVMNIERKLAPKQETHQQWSAEQ